MEDKDKKIINEFTENKKKILLVVVIRVLSALYYQWAKTSTLRKTSTIHIITIIAIILLIIGLIIEAMALNLSFKLELIQNKTSFGLYGIMFGIQDFILLSVLAMNIKNISKLRQILKFYVFFTYIYAGSTFSIMVFESSNH